MVVWNLVSGQCCGVDHVETENFRGSVFFHSSHGIVDPPFYFTHNFTPLILLFDVCGT